jgi:hypothetical protein
MGYLHSQRNFPACQLRKRAFESCLLPAGGWRGPFSPDGALCPPAQCCGARRYVGSSRRRGLWAKAPLGQWSALQGGGVREHQPQHVETRDVLQIVSPCSFPRCCAWSSGHRRAPLRSARTGLCPPAERCGARRYVGSRRRRVLNPKRVAARIRRNAVGDLCERCSVGAAPRRFRPKVSRFRPQAGHYNLHQRRFAEVSVGVDELMQLFPR